MRAIVFALNGCPAGWLGAYGNDWVGTPNLDRLAAEGVVFDRHFSHDPLSRSLAFGSRLRDTTTILVRANHPDTDAPPPYYAGWGEVFDARPQPDDDSPLSHLLRAFPALLDRLAGEPNFLLWIETDRLLPPWDVQQDVFEAYLDDEDEEPTQLDADEDEPDDEDDFADGEGDSEPTLEVEDEKVPPYSDPPTGPFDRSDLDAWDYLHRTFAAVVTKLDAELGQLFEGLRSRGLDQSAAWLVTSDLGLPLGEHGQIGLYRPWLHEELVHLPLILRLPGAEQGGRRVSGFTQPPDLLPTLHSLLGSKPSASADGFGLLPLARGEASARTFAITQMELNGAAEIAIRTDEWALLVPTQVPEGDPPREPRLYGKPDDRWEVNDLRARNIEHADELDALLKAEIQKTSTAR